MADKTDWKAARAELDGIIDEREALLAPTGGCCSASPSRSRRQSRRQNGFGVTSMDIFAQTRAELDQAEREARNMMRFMIVFFAVWVVFLMGAIGAGLFILGRWTGVW